MESTPTERTPAVVAGEIAAIKAQTRKDIACQRG
jgi:hypothetical protein